MNSVVFKRTFRLSGILIIQTGDVAINYPWASKAVYFVSWSQFPVIAVIEQQN